MQSLLSSAVQRALPHALPFRVIFEEHRLRREKELLRSAKEVFAAMPTPPPGKDTEAQLLAALEQQEAAYLDLCNTSEALEQGEKNLKLDGCLKRCAEADAPLKRVLHAMQSSAVCLSGGGIRSASFGLGVLEGLARFGRRGNRRHRSGGLMKQLDYLSTVSGGGYIGSWLIAWVYRRKLAADKPSEAGSVASGGTVPLSNKPWEQAYGEVLAALAGDSNVTGGDPEPLPVRHLRSYTSYLAPELGMTLDTFTLGAIVLRNLMVNWTMVVPVVVALIAAAESSAYLFSWATGSLRNGLSRAILPWHIWHLDRMTWGGLVIGACFCVAAWAGSKVLPSHRKENAGGNGLVWVFLAGVLAGCWLIAASATEKADGTIFWSKFGIALLGYGLLGTSIVRSYVRRARQRGTEARWREGIVMAMVAALTMAAATSGLLYWAQGASVFGVLRQPPTGFWQPHGSEGRLFTVFAPPLVLLILTLTGTLFTALMGLFQTEDDREWWVRCGGAMLAAGLGWMAVNGAALFGRGGWHYIESGIAGLVLGLAGSWLGFSTTTAATAKASSDEVGKVGKFLVQHKLVLPAIGGSSLLLIGLGLVAVEEQLRCVMAQHIFRQAGTGYLSHGLRSAVTLFIVAAGAGCLVNLAISINLFSLSGMYRMRLMRAFLGASNVYRHPDPFTHFDWRDTPYESELPCAAGVPLHLANTTLNLAGTKNAAWRQRKGEGFSFSAVASGGWRVGYVPADTYGGSRGTTLATAMAISGAAANPNMGYQTSPLLSLLMTFFNLRLGYWLPNPASAATMAADEQRRLLQSSAPRLALWPLFEDALGLTDDKKKWVELTDGGHFENLGLYEMVLRRCRRIVVVDASADKEFGYEDLGNAIRKIKIDLGVPISFLTPLRRSKPEEGGVDCAVAEIDYACADGQGTQPGQLVYLKPCVNGEALPADVLQYARTHVSFPHESTGNQFFNESQFESYRQLGSFLVEQIGDTPALGGGYGMEGFYEAAKRYAEIAEQVNAKA